MFWLVVPAAIIGVGVVAGILSSISESDKNARKRWDAKHKEAEKTVAEHNKNIDAHIRKVSSSYDFHFLVDLHYSSLRVGDNAYSLLNDARESISSISAILDKVTNAKNNLKVDLISASATKKEEILTEIRSLNSFKSSVIEDLKILKEQKEKLYSEVKRLNAQTSNLKMVIKERCGVKGQEWYLRLEARKALKNR